MRADVLDVSAEQVIHAFFESSVSIACANRYGFAWAQNEALLDSIAKTTVPILRVILSDWRKYQKLPDPLAFQTDLSSMLKKIAIPPSSFPERN